MKNFKLLGNIFLGVLVLSVVCSGVSFAGDNAGAAFLVEVGEKDILRGNIEQALHEFSKALMLDPSNEKALAYMREYGFKEGLYAGTSTRVSEAARFGMEHKRSPQEVGQKEVEILAKDTEIAKTRELLDKVKAHRDQISRELTDKNLQLYAMEAELGKFKAELAINDQRFEGQVSQLDELYQSIEQEMAKVREQDAELARINAGDSGRIGAYESQLIALQQEYDLLREQRHQSRHQQQMLYNQVEEYAYLRNQLIDDLADELLYKDLDMAQKDSFVLAKLEQIEHLDQLIENHRRQIAEQYETIQRQQSDMAALRGQLED